MLKVRIKLKKTQFVRTDGRYEIYSFTHYGEKKEAHYPVVEFAAHDWKSALTSFDFDEVKELSITDVTEEHIQTAFSL